MKTTLRTLGPWLVIGLGVATLAQAGPAVVPQPLAPPYDDVEVCNRLTVFAYWASLDVWADERERWHADQLTA